MAHHVNLLSRFYTVTCRRCGTLAEGCSRFMAGSVVARHFMNHPYHVVAWHEPDTCPWPNLEATQ